MSINKRYVNHSTLWYNETEQLAHKICDLMDERELVKTGEQKKAMYHCIMEEMDMYTVYKQNKSSKAGGLLWRLSYLFLILFQWILWPYCFYKWLTTGSSRLNSKSKLGMLIDRIVEQAS